MFGLCNVTKKILKKIKGSDHAACGHSHFLVMDLQTMKWRRDYMPLNKKWQDLQEYLSPFHDANTVTVPDFKNPNKIYFFGGNNSTHKVSVLHMDRLDPNSLK